MLTIDLNDLRFISMSGKFCQKIDRYAPILEVDPVVVQTYKTNSRILEQILLNYKNYNGALQGFANQKIEYMKSVFRAIAQLCKNSGRYTRDIGIELGIEDVTWSVPYYPN